MERDATAEAGWSLIADGDSITTLIGGLLELDPDGAYSRSDLAEATGVPLKTLHLGDDVERIVDLGLLERHDPEGEEVFYTVDETSDILRQARAFGEAVAGAGAE